MELQWADKICRPLFPFRRPAGHTRCLGRTLRAYANAASARSQAHYLLASRSLVSSSRAPPTRSHLFVRRKSSRAANSTAALTERPNRPTYREEAIASQTTGQSLPGVIRVGQYIIGLRVVREGGSCRGWLLGQIVGALATNGAPSTRAPLYSLGQAIWAFSSGGGREV